MILTEDVCTLIPGARLKHSRQNFVRNPITFKEYPEYPILCPVKIINEYIQ